VDEQQQKGAMPKSHRPISDLGFKFLNSAHKVVLRLSGGRLGSTMRGMPAVELHTVGRKSGQPRSSMLTSPVHDEDRVVLVASRGGADGHPSWYLNLTANPDVEVTIYGETSTMRARTATPEEKAALWPQIVAAYKPYEGYQKRSSRDIPVVICEPRPA
jgi:deazaflavin-dependent oxidoreductase (nitroreductase family)